MGRGSRISAAVAGSFGFLLLTAPIASSKDPNTLQIFYDVALINNPIAGLGNVANQSDVAVNFRSVPDIQVESNLYIEMLMVHDQNNTFDVRFWWHLRYTDERVYPLIWASETDGCQALCASDPSKVLNQNGTAGCCDAVYVPNARFRNHLNTASKTFSSNFYILATADSPEVNFWRRSFVSFRGTLEYGGFPFNKQYLRLIVITDFIPFLTDKSFLAVPSLQGLPKTLDNYPAYDRAGLLVLGWDVMEFSANLIGIRYKLNNNGPSVQAAAQPGISYTITVQRRTDAFYIYIMVLPICLLVLMAALESLVETEGLKFRMELLGGILFAILFMQFGIRDYQPAALLIPPYMVIIAGYVFISLLASGYLLADLMESGPRYAEQRKGWLVGRLRFVRFLSAETSLQAAESGPGQQQVDGSSGGIGSAVERGRALTRKQVRLHRRLDRLTHRAAERHRFAATGPYGWIKYWWLPIWWQIMQLEESHDYVKAITHATQEVWVPLCIGGFYLFTTLVYTLSD